MGIREERRRKGIDRISSGRDGGWEEGRRRDGQNENRRRDWE